MIKVKKKSIKRCLIIIIIVLTLILGALIALYFTSKQKLEEYNTELLELHAKLEANNKYISCLITPYKSEEVDTLFNELLNTLNTNELSIYFEDLNNEYTLTINPDTIYYNASIIKLFDASYIIDNNVDLNDTITFTSEYRNLAKEGLLDYELNAEVPIRDVMYYAISVSDNGAHRMLTDYIGVDNLRNYAHDTLGVNLTINENDRFGYMNVTTTNTLLKHVYELLQNDNEYTTLLKDAMNNTYYNALNFDDITYLHKYGYYNQYFHDIGIYDDYYNPYTISIFTLYGNPDTGALDEVSNISKEIYNIYETNLDKKEEYCYNLAYN